MPYIHIYNSRSSLFIFSDRLIKIIADTRHTWDIVILHLRYRNLDNPCKCREGSVAMEITPLRGVAVARKTQQWWWRRYDRFYQPFKPPPWKLWLKTKGACHLRKMEGGKTKHQFLTYKADTTCVTAALKNDIAKTPVGSKQGQKPMNELSLSQHRLGSNE